MFIINAVSPVKDISYSERRKLTRFPSLTMKLIFNGKFMEDFEKYALDQFPFRDNFRSIKAHFELDIFRKLDNNNVYTIDDNLFKIEYPIKPHNIQKTIDHMNTVYNLYLKGMNVYYSIIPDKSYFAADKRGYLGLDYIMLENMMRENIKDIIYIDIFDTLTLDDYYNTDVHWRQEKLDKVVSRIIHAMGLEESPEDGDYTQKQYYPFYGAYYGQSALNPKPDTLIYRTNPYIDAAKVYNYDPSIDKDAPFSVYNEDSLGTVDSYDVFLWGASPIIEIMGDNIKTDRELIIFRDSFASSIAPLLLEHYSKITLIDTRYVNHKLLGSFVEFKDQDVLFLYNTVLINNGNILK